MSVFPQLERLLWLHDQIKRNLFPNAARLSEAFEVSVKTAQRDIDHLRDRFNAPLSYDFTRRGYSYSNDLYELPGLPGSQQEILCLLMAQSLLNRSAGGYISRELDKLREKLFLAAQPSGLSAESVGKLFSAVWSGFSPVQEKIFRVVTHALLKNRLIRFTYRSPASDETTTRIGEPHHLQFYMASWVLIAYCRERQDFRKFYLSRMTDLQLLEAVFEPRSEDDWRPLLENAFGLFQGWKCVPVILRFSPFRARWIREQQWHPDQTLAERPDGGLDLTLLVADFREIKMKILQFGADCEVLSPEALRIEVQSEIARMAEMYRKK